MVAMFAVLASWPVINLNTGPVFMILLCIATATIVANRVIAADVS